MSGLCFILEEIKDSSAPNGRSRALKHGAEGQLTVTVGETKAAAVVHPGCS